MKPRTKLEIRVTGLSSKLSAVTEVQKEWAKEHIFTHEAYRCKDELWCSECGGTWIDTSNSELGTTLLRYDRMPVLPPQTGRKDQPETKSRGRKVHVHLTDRRRVPDHKAYTMLQVRQKKEF